MDRDEKKKVTIELAKEVESELNRFYDTMAKRLFNCDNHRFSIKGESVMETGFWVVKKRYAMRKVFDLETDQDMDKVSVKGLDVVRSSFPPAFATFMKNVLDAILKKESKDHLDRMILDFKKEMKSMDYMLLARNTSVKKVRIYDDPKETSLTNFPLGAAAHSKAAVTHNRILRKLGLDKKYPPIEDGSKIKWVYCSKNPYNIESIAFKGYEDPPEILDIVTKYMDYNKLFEKELETKLSDFYEALGFGKLPTKVNQNAMKFFTF